MSFPSVNVPEPRLESPVTDSDVGLVEFLEYPNQHIQLRYCFESLVHEVVGKSAGFSNQSSPREAQVGFGCGDAATIPDRSSCSARFWLRS